MSTELRDLRREVAELREEVDALRVDYARLRRAVHSLRLTTVGTTDYEHSSEGSDSRVGSRSDSRDFSICGGYSTGSVPAASGPGPTSRTSPSPSGSRGATLQRSSAISWEERENIADQIGLWIARALSGEHRGESGRGRNPLGSKLWVVARDLAGQLHSSAGVSVLEFCQDLGQVRIPCRRFGLCGLAERA